MIRYPEPGRRGPIDVVLSDADEAWAEQVGRDRYEWADRPGVDQRNYAPGLPDRGPQRLAANVVGARAELAVARAYDVPWFPMRSSAAERHAPDVGNVDVRATVWTTGCLLLRPGDPGHRANVLVVVGGGRIGYRIVGWAWGNDVMRPRWWRTDRPPPCWMFPQSLLHDPGSLPLHRGAA